MTTTLIKTNNPSSRIYNLTGLESLSFKMVSIFFIVILNITHLSSQTSDPTGKIETFTYVAVNSLKETKSEFAPTRPKVYTVYLAKTFPTLQSGSNQKLQAMNDSETFDYNEMFSDSLHKHNVGASKIISLSLSKYSKKHSKNKLAPKLNS